MKLTLVIALALLPVISLYSQADTIRIMSYNVENLFDCKHDSLKNDVEYTPEGKRGWTYKKYKQKQANISKVIAAVGGWNRPSLVGLCEIENEAVLKDLTRYSPLKKFKYQYLHQESPDRRGIDVALLYQKKDFKPIKTEYIEIKIPKHHQIKTRDILYAKGLFKNNDTLHVFVTHFPSRLGGEKASEYKRIYVASQIRKKVDSIFLSNSNSNIIIMGDFNDYPTNISIKESLNANKITETTLPNNLYNPFFQFQEEGIIGTNNYKGEWGVLDQIIISSNLMNTNNSSFYLKESAQIFNKDFLLEENTKLLIKQPLRTYKGYKYLGGYSDHLPVYIDLIIK